MCSKNDCSCSVKESKRVVMMMYWLQSIFDIFGFKDSDFSRSCRPFLGLFTQGFHVFTVSVGFESCHILKTFDDNESASLFGILIPVVADASWFVSRSLDGFIDFRSGSFNALRFHLEGSNNLNGSSFHQNKIRIT